MVKSSNIAFLEITRPTSYVAMMVPCKVFIDNENVGDLGNGQTQSIQVTAGQHVVYVKRGFTARSNDLSVNCASDQTVRLQVTQNGLLKQFLLRYTGRKMAQVSGMVLEQLP